MSGCGGRSVRPEWRNLKRKSKKLLLMRTTHRAVVRGTGADLMRLNIRPSGDAGPPNVSLLCLPTRNANERTLLTTTRTKHRQLTFILNHIRHFFLVSLSTLRSSPAPSPLLKACAPASSFLRAYLSIRFSPRTNDGQTTRPSNLFASVIFSNRFLASLLALSISSSSLKFSSTEN